MKILLSIVWQLVFSTENEIQESPYDGYNQQPSIYPAVDNQTFYQFSVEPNGRGAKVLKESHFVNTATGEYSKFVAEPGTINPDTACKVVRETLTNHRWGEYVRNDKEPWNMAGKSKESKSLTLEPLPRSVDGKNLFYRVFVTSTSFTGSENSERVFVDGQSKATSVYHKRSDYLSFLNKHISPVRSDLSDRAVSELSTPSPAVDSKLVDLIIGLEDVIKKNSQALDENRKFIEEQKELIKAQSELLKLQLDKSNIPPVTQ